MKTNAFVTFSNTAYTKNTQYYKNFISTLEKDCRLNIIHKWYNKTEINPTAIYKSSLLALKKAEILIVEATVPSTGIGQLISLALQKNIKVLICVKEEMRTTFDNSLLRGVISGLISYIYYINFSGLKKQLSNLHLNTDESMLEKFNFLATKQIKDILRKESMKRKISQSELLREIIYEWAKLENVK